MFTKPTQQSSIPIYIQVKEQIIHAIERGAILPGDQLPSVRALSEQLVINPNTVIKIYRELEMEDILEIRHGMGAFLKRDSAVGANAAKIHMGVSTIQKMIDMLMGKGLTSDEIRRIVELELQKRDATRIESTKKTT